jgi:holo-[acyl-carrier protein] synthase
MTILGLGVDIVETARIAAAILRHGEAFLHRVFTEGEVAYCSAMRDPNPFYAARFAAKEAVSKAFGTGLGGEMTFREIDIQRKESGEPFVVLSGAAQATADRLGIVEVRISLSHSEKYSVANAIAIGA